MRQRPWVMIGIMLLAGLVLWSIFEPQQTTSALRRLVGASGPRRTRTLDLPPPDASHPVANAARRLIQPFGGVHLVRTFDSGEQPIPEDPAVQR